LHTRLDQEVLVRNVAGTPSLPWVPFKPNGEPAGEIALAFETSELPNGSIQKVSLWRHESGDLEYKPMDHELVYLISGAFELHSAGGQFVSVRAGQVVLIPAGFIGTWRTLDAVTKVSLIIARSSSNSQTEGEDNAAGN